jgi:hypothetical protein
VSASITRSRGGPSPSGIRWPIVWTVALALGVVFAPFPMASVWSGGGYPDRAALVDSLSSAVVHFWDASTGVTGADLADPVSFWARFHVVKALLAAMLLVALALLGSRAWSAYTRAATTGRRLALGACVVVVGSLALLALVVTVANLQGAIAPLSSALGLLPFAEPDAALAQTVEQVRQGLASGTRNPALEALVNDFTVYHLAMAALAAAATVGLLATAVHLWRRRAKMSTARGRGLLLFGVVLTLTSAAFFAVVTAGNLSTVANPVPALLSFFAGGG